MSECVVVEWLLCMYVERVWRLSECSSACGCVGVVGLFRFAFQSLVSRNGFEGVSRSFMIHLC